MLAENAVEGLLGSIDQLCRAGSGIGEPDGGRIAVLRKVQAMAVGVDEDRHRAAHRVLVAQLAGCRHGVVGDIGSERLAAVGHIGERTRMHDALLLWGCRDVNGLLPAQLHPCAHTGQTEALLDEGLRLLRVVPGRLDAHAPHLRCRTVAHAPHIGNGDTAQRLLDVGGLQHADALVTRKPLGIPCGHLCKGVSDGDAAAHRDASAVLNGFFQGGDIVDGFLLVHLGYLGEELVDAVTVEGLHHLLLLHHLHDAL